MLVGKGLGKLVGDIGNLGHFVNIYNCTPEDFKKKYEGDGFEFELKDSEYVVTVSCYDEYNAENTPLVITGIYQKKTNQKAIMSYKGHITFIDIFNEEGKLIETLCKDDECPAENFNEFCDYTLWCDEDFPKFNKKYFFDLIQNFIRNVKNDPYLEIKEEDLYIVQGL